MPNFTLLCAIKKKKSLEFTIIVFAWPLPDYHNVYKSFCRSIRNISISDLINNVSAKYLCPGVDGVKSSNIISHVVPCEVDLQDDNWHENPFQTRGYERSKTCFVIHDENHQPCLNCEHSAKISKCKSKAFVLQLHFVLLCCVYIFYNCFYTTFYIVILGSPACRKDL